MEWLKIEYGYIAICILIPLVIFSAFKKPKPKATTLNGVLKDRRNGNIAGGIILIMALILGTLAVIQRINIEGMQ